jgi:hypothetical protein
MYSPFLDIIIFIFIEIRSRSDIFIILLIALYRIKGQAQFW